MGKLLATGYDIVPSETTFFSPDASIDDDGKLHVPTESSSYEFGSDVISKESSGAGHRATGKRSFLAVTVKTNDGNPGADAATLSDVVFDNSLSLGGQLSQCSYNKMSLTKATGSGVQDGVFELSLNMNSNGVSSQTVFNSAVRSLSDILGDLPSQYDFVMFCFPDNVDFGGAGTYL